MKAKDYIIIGGAVALFLLWKNKNKKVGTSTTTTEGTTTTVSPRPLKMPHFQMGYNPDFKFDFGTKNPTAGTSQVTVLETPPPSNEPEQVFGVGQPSGMDLPVLTAGTGIPTEVAIQQGGVITTPKPAIVQPINMTIEESLTAGNINPIEKPTVNPFPIKELLNVEPILTSPAINTYPLKDLDYIAIKPFVYNEQPILQNQPFNSNQYDGAPIYIPQDRFISTLI
jgi:hypothetical protein